MTNKPVLDTHDINVIYNIFDRINNLSGRKDKIDFIALEKETKGFKYFLKFLYDETITTGIDKKKLNKHIGITNYHEFNDFFDAMEYVAVNNTGKDIVIKSVQEHIAKYEDVIQEFLKDVITKKYKCGITANSINKSFGYDFIKQFKVQLAHPFEKYEHKVDGEFYLTRKLDGHRVLAYSDGYDVTFRTRKGHEIHGLDYISDEIISTFGGSISNGLVFDGEITISDSDTPEDKVFNETSKILRKDGEKQGLTFHVFDIIKIEDFASEVSTRDYATRRRVLNQLQETPHFKIVPVLYRGSDKTVIPELLEKHVALGHEGLMLNTADGLYKTKRTQDLLKVKKFNSADVKAIDVFEGDAKYKDMLGGIVLDYKGYEVSCGSGFSDGEREYYWNNQDEIIGKIVEIQYFGESYNQNNDDISLRFPTFKMIREDKIMEDISYD